MSIEFLPPDVDELTPRITVIGVGGAGGNAIANMIKAEVQGVDFLVAKTDAQALKSSPAEQRIQLGAKITQGLGAGSRPEIGRAAAEETIEAVERALDGAHMCFIAAGMGGGTGTGAAPVIAKAARDRGILTVGVVTKPFSFEGSRRMKSADAGIAELQKHVDTLIVIPNQNLFLIANADSTFKEAFAMADEVLQQGVRGITDLMIMPGLINLDFADVRSVMGEMGKAMMGTGEASGDNRAIEAAEKAIANPNTTFKEAFQMADEVLQQGVRGITDLMVMPGLINLDFADVRSVMGEMGKAMMGTGEAEGDGRALAAAEKAIANPLLDGVSMKGAKGVIVSITGGEDMRLLEVDEAANHIRELVDPDANIIWGSAFNDNLNGKIRVSVVATGIESEGSSAGSSQPFSFAARSQPVATPVSAEAAPSAAAEAPRMFDAPTQPDAASEEAMDLGGAEIVEEVEAEVVEPQPVPPVAPAAPVARFDDIDGNDELLLGAETAVQPASAPQPAPAAPAAAAKPAGTLFERMSGLSRGLGRGQSADDEDDDGPTVTKFPQFLNRQGNQ